MTETKPNETIKPFVTADGAEDMIAEEPTHVTGSFSKRCKHSLQNLPIRKKCCRYLWDSVMAIPKEENAAAELRRLGEGCLCETCITVLLRAMFVRWGTVTDPAKRYHLELTFATEEERVAAEEILEKAGLAMHPSLRKCPGGQANPGGREKYLLYYKSSTDIEDFLATIGASGAVFDLMNTKIVKEFRNSVNRQVNCDTANIGKQLEASKKYIEAIQYLTETGAINRLPDALRDTARLRLEYDQLSLADLGNLCEPKVSKSGMKHRMEKLLTFAKNLEEHLGAEKSTQP